jgi:hypothetical protein
LGSHTEDIDSRLAEILKRLEELENAPNLQDLRRKTG